MNKLNLRYLALLGTLAGVTLIPAQADINTNGTFLGSPGDYTTLTFGSTAITGWTVTSGSVDWVGNYWGAVPPSGGANSIDLDGTSPGAISTTFATTAGQTYLLTFDLNGNSDGPPATKMMDVLLNGSQIGSNFTFMASGHPVSSVGAPPSYAAESLFFTAALATTSTTLTFNSLDGGQSPYGPVIANVSVNAAPEPAFFAALGLGLCGLFVAARRRRKV